MQSNKKLRKQPNVFAEKCLKIVFLGIKWDKLLKKLFNYLFYNSFLYYQTDINKETL
jgi:hypothetical protein